MKDKEENTGNSECHPSRWVDENTHADGDKNLSVQDVPARGNQAHRLQIHRSYIFFDIE
jgi:hypothetical protein